MIDPFRRLSPRRRLSLSIAGLSLALLAVLLAFGLRQ
jgi:hypothetical protein